MPTSERRSRATSCVRATRKARSSKRVNCFFEIDPRPFQAALDQAEGQLAQAKAQLANAQAVQGRTQLDVERYTPLAKSRPPASRISTTPFRTTSRPRPRWQLPRPRFKTDEAAVETAKINLDFTRLVAPIDGIAGQAQHQVGALVSPSSGPVTSVSTVDPIKVYFTVGEPQYLAWRKRFPTEPARVAADKNSAARTDSGRRLDLSARGHILLRRPPGE